jgi:hypothetical protein
MSSNNRYSDTDEANADGGEQFKPAVQKVEYVNGKIETVAPPVYRIPSNVVDMPETKIKKPLMTRIMHSFKRREDNITLNALGQQVFKDDPEKIIGSRGDGAPVSHDTSRLKRKLQGRHMQMIAIGGAIGTGLFIGSGSALATGGPAALVLGFGLIGMMLFCVIHALGELAVMFPISGESTRFILINYKALSLFILPVSSTLRGASPWVGTTPCNGWLSCPLN